MGKVCGYCPMMKLLTKTRPQVLTTEELVETRSKLKDCGWEFAKNSSVTKKKHIPLVVSKQCKDVLLFDIKGPVKAEPIGALAKYNEALQGTNANFVCEGGYIKYKRQYLPETVLAEGLTLPQVSTFVDEFIKMKSDKDFIISLGDNYNVEFNKGGGTNNVTVNVTVKPTNGVGEPAQLKTKEIPGCDAVFLIISDDCYAFQPNNGHSESSTAELSAATVEAFLAEYNKKKQGEEWPFTIPLGNGQRVKFTKMEDGSITSCLQNMYQIIDAEKKIESHIQDIYEWHNLTVRNSLKPSDDVVAELKKAVKENQLLKMKASCVLWRKVPETDFNRKLKISTSENSQVESDLIESFQAQIASNSDGLRGLPSYPKKYTTPPNQSQRDHGISPNEIRAQQSQAHIRSIFPTGPPLLVPPSPKKSTPARPHLLGPPVPRHKLHAFLEDSIVQGDSQPPVSPQNANKTHKKNSGSGTGDVATSDTQDTEAPSTPSRRGSILSRIFTSPTRQRIEEGRVKEKVRIIEDKVKRQRGV